MDFKTYDKTHQYYYRDDRLKMAKKYGYEFISEATVELYKKHQSSQKVGKMLEVSGNSILLELKNFQSIVEIRKRGGNNGRKTYKKIKGIKCRTEIKITE